MPNWVDQEFAITGAADDIDKFCALAVTGNFRRNRTLEDEPTFRFSKVCPIRRRDRPACTDRREDGVLLRFNRTGIQAHFNIQTSWDFPSHFYLHRLLRDWAGLSFCCAINEDMDNFGGVVAGFDGIATDAVASYGTGYDRKAHARQIRPLLARWSRVVLADRPWSVELPLTFRPLAIYKCAATCDDLITTFYFTGELECRRFGKRYKSSKVYRRVGRGWKITRHLT